MRSNDREGLFYFEVLYLLGLLADVSQNTTISVQDLAVDKVGSMGGQEHAGANHVLGGAPAACGGLGADEGIEGMAAAIGLDLAQGSGLSGGNVAGPMPCAPPVTKATLPFRSNAVRSISGTPLLKDPAPVRRCGVWFVLSAGRW